MTSDSLREVLAALRSSGQAEIAGDLRMRLCHSSGSLRVFIAVVGHIRDAAIVIDIPKHLVPANLASMSSRRFAVTASGPSGLPPDRGAVVIVLRDNQFEDLFLQLGAQIIQETRGAVDAADGLRRTVRVIDRWRRFFERHRETLSEEEVRGLIGELAILERLTHRIGARGALSTWRSPGGAIIDFSCGDRTIEVKTFLTSDGPSVRMSDPLQLEGEPGIPLFLACHELSRSTDVDLALPGHVARLTALFADDLVLREDFDDLLSAYGYLSVHAAHYVQGYRLGELLAFRVDDDFPRIRLADIPASVVRVQFSIEIQHLRRHAMSADQSIGPAVASEALRP